MVAGAMAELDIGDPAILSTDVGPIIDEEARATIAAYVAEARAAGRVIAEARRRQRQRSEEHTSELQSLMRISYAVFCLKKKKKKTHKKESTTQTTKNNKKLTQSEAITTKAEARLMSDN